jgi:hypothetical protein
MGHRLVGGGAIFVNNNRVAVRGCLIGKLRSTFPIRLTRHGW